MGHKRVKMELIKNERNRIQTYKKRKANLLKKMSEFSILCGVEACLIMFGPTHKDGAAKEEGEENELGTWPSDHQAVRGIIHRYRTSDGPKRTYHLSDYFTEKKKRVDLELAKINKQIYRHKFFPASWDSRLDAFSADQLTALLAQLDSKLQLADQKLANLSSTAAAKPANCYKMLEFDLTPIPAVIRNSDNYGFAAAETEKLALCNDSVSVLQTLQFDHQMPQQQQQQQGSFMALLNANSSVGANDGIQYCDPYSDNGLQQQFSDVNSFGCYSAEEELSPTELSRVRYSIDFELYNHQVNPVVDGQMMSKRFGGGGYGQGLGYYSTTLQPWGLDLSCGEFGMNYSDGSMMSYMNSPVSSIQQILQQQQLQFPTAAAGFAAHYHQGQFSQQVDGGGDHHVAMNGSSGFNQK